MRKSSLSLYYPHALILSQWFTLYPLWLNFEILLTLLLCRHFKDRFNQVNFKTEHTIEYVLAYDFKPCYRIIILFNSVQKKIPPPNCIFTKQKTRKKLLCALILPTPTYIYLPTKSSLLLVRFFTHFSYVRFLVLPNTH